MELDTTKTKQTSDTVLTKVAYPVSRYSTAELLARYTVMGNVIDSDEYGKTCRYICCLNDSDMLKELQTARLNLVRNIYIASMFAGVATFVLSLALFGLSIFWYAIATYSATVLGILWFTDRMEDRINRMSLKNPLTMLELTAIRALVFSKIKELNEKVDLATKYGVSKIGFRAHTGADTHSFDSNEVRVPTRKSLVLDLVSLKDLGDAIQTVKRYNSYVGGDTTKENLDRKRRAIEAAKLVDRDDTGFRLVYISDCALANAPSIAGEKQLLPLRLLLSWLEETAFQPRQEDYWAYELINHARSLSIIDNVLTPAFEAHKKIHENLIVQLEGGGDNNDDKL